MPAEDEAREVRPPTLTEQERALEQAASENLNLKMRVQQLEEQLGERGPGGGDESMSIWDVRSALSRERELHQQRERIIEEAAREVTERDELLERSRSALADLRAENARLVQQNEHELQRQLATKEAELKEDLLRQFDKRAAELEEWGHRQIEIVRAQEQKKGEEAASQKVREARGEEQAISSRELGQLQSEMDGLLEQQQREAAQLVDDLRLRLRLSEQALAQKEEEARAAEADVHGWRRQRDDQEGAMQRLRCDYEMIKEELLRERRERAEEHENRQKAATDIDAAALEARMMEAQIEELTRRLDDLGREAERLRREVGEARGAERTSTLALAQVQEDLRQRQASQRQADDLIRDLQRQLDDSKLHVEKLEVDLQDAKENVLKSSARSIVSLSASHSVRSDARLMSAPPPTPLDRMDLAAALERERERAVDAEEELRVMKRRLGQVEHRAREAEADVAGCRARALEAEEEARVLRGSLSRLRDSKQPVLKKDSADQQMSPGDNRGDLQRESLDAGGDQEAWKRTEALDGSVDSVTPATPFSPSERQHEWLQKALKKVQAKSKECAQLQWELEAAREEASKAREEAQQLEAQQLEAARPRERELQARERECARLKEECARLQSAVMRLEDEAVVMQAKHADLENEADMVAELLLKVEGSSELSATQLVQEALAKCEQGAVLSATGLVRDALAQHVKSDPGAGLTTTSPVDLTPSSLTARLPPAAPMTPTTPTRVVSFANDADNAPPRDGAQVGTRGEGGIGQSAALRAQLATVLDEKAELEAHIEEMQKHLAEMHTQTQAALQEREQALQDMAKKIEQAANRDIDTNLRIAISDANRRVAHVQMQLAAAVAERDEARRVSHDLNTTLASFGAAQKDAEELLTTIHGLRAERGNLLDEARWSAREIARLRGDVDELEGKYSAAQAKLAAHSAQFDEMLRLESWQRHLDVAGQAQHDSDSAVQRLRECNRLLILELEETRERLRDERRRRYVAECAAVSAGAVAQNVTSTAASADSLGGSDTVDSAVDPAAAELACRPAPKFVLPPVTPKTHETKVCLPAPDDLGSPLHGQGLLKGSDDHGQGHDEAQDQEEAEQVFSQDAGALIEGTHAPATAPLAASQGESPSPEPQWSTPEGLRASRVICRSSAATNHHKGGGGGNRCESVEDSSYIAQEREGIGLEGSEERETSGATRYAATNAATPTVTVVSDDFSAAHTHLHRTETPKSLAVSARKEKARDMPRQQGKKGLESRGGTALRPQSASPVKFAGGRRKKPLAALTRSSVNARGPQDAFSPRHAAR